MTLAIQRIAVHSSSLRTVGYREGEGVLEAEFRDGTMYRYFLIPAEVWRGLLAAPSQGAFFNQHVRSAYPCVRVETGHPDTLHADLTASLEALQGAGKTTGGSS